MHSPLPVVWFQFIVNLLLQAFDGFLTYQVLSLGVPELNPLVRNTIMQWGVVWGLLYWKIFACVLLLIIFALRHRERSLTIKAFALTAAVYAYVSIGGVCMLVLHFNE
jgi:hypothetical protein